MASSKKKAVEVVPAKRVMVNLFNTNYHRFRHWIRYILIDGKVPAKGFRFIKADIGYTGKLVVEKTEVDRAKKVLADYKAKNTGAVDMWW